MKRIGVSALAAFALIASLALPGVLLAQQPQQPETRSPSAVMHRTQNQEQTKTFTGTINKKGDDFVLQLPSAKTYYFLDDQKKAAPFEGKTVKVTGILDAGTNTITIQTIEPA